MKARLSALKCFRINRHSKYNLSARRISAIEDFIQKRIREIAEYAVKAELLQIVDERGCAAPLVYNRSSSMRED